MYLRGDAVVPCTCSVLMRRAVVERVKAFEEEFRALYTDQILYAKMVLAAPVMVVDQCWDRYRQNPESSCSRALLSDYSRTARFEYLNWVARYLTTHGVSDAQLWHALEHERWRSRHPQMAKFVVRARRVLKGVQGWCSSRALKSSEGL
jgi:hypothetical protein